jgi:adenine-specific DNA-methyltransferase
MLDFFSGSGSSANAIFDFNADNSASWRFIQVQLPEKCEEGSSAFKAGYSTIADLSKERFRRAGNAAKQRNPLLTSDTGFRVLKIDTSNMADVYYTPDAVTQEGLFAAVDNIKPDRTAFDLLFQVMLDWGVDLALPIEKMTIQGKEVYFVDDNALAACFDHAGGIDDAFAKELATHQPLRAVFRDAGFKDSTVKINIEQIFKLLSPATEVKCL